MGTGASFPLHGGDSLPASIDIETIFANNSPDARGFYCLGPSHRVHRNDLEAFAASLRERERLSDVIDEHRNNGGSSWQDINFERRGALGPEMCDKLEKNRKDGPASSSQEDSVEWLLPADIVGDEDPALSKGALRLFPDGRSPEASDVLEGNIGDCFLIAALSVLANSQSDRSLIKRLFVNEPDLTGCGPVGVQFFHDGRWKTIFVDQRLAVYKVRSTEEEAEREEGMNSHHHRRLLFGRAQDPHHLWLPLLEKAYAKLYGSFSAISGGNVSEALRDLTGFATLDFSLDSPATVAMLQDGSLWRNLVSWMKPHGSSRSSPADGSDEALVACATVVDPKMASDASAVGGGNEFTTKEGLLENHAYSIIDIADIKADRSSGESGSKKAKTIRLLKVRNPWGYFSWRGAWSNGDTKRWTGELRERLHYHSGGEDEKDHQGEFWMSWEDFRTHFNRIYVALPGSGPPPLPPLQAASTPAAETPAADGKSTGANEGGSWFSAAHSSVSFARAQWDPHAGTAGGADHHPTWRRNPIFRLTIRHSDDSEASQLSSPSEDVANVVLSLSQPDRRLQARREGSAISYAPIGIIVVRTRENEGPQLTRMGGGEDAAGSRSRGNQNSATPPQQQPHMDVLTRTSFWNKRDVATTVSQPIERSVDHPHRRSNHHMSDDGESQMRNGSSTRNDGLGESLLEATTYVVPSTFDAGFGGDFILSASVASHLRVYLERIDFERAFPYRASASHSWPATATGPSSKHNPIFRLKFKKRPAAKGSEGSTEPRADNAGTKKLFVFLRQGDEEQKKLPGIAVYLYRGWEAARLHRKRGQVPADAAVGPAPVFTNLMEVSRGASLLIQDDDGEKPGDEDEDEAVLIMPSQMFPKGASKHSDGAAAPRRKFHLEVCSHEIELEALELVVDNPKEAKSFSGAHVLLPKRPPGRKEVRPSAAGGGSAGAKTSLGDLPVGDLLADHATGKRKGAGFVASLYGDLE